jgi:hypothetical protein
MAGTQPSRTSELPIACTLGLDDGAARMERWHALSAVGPPSARREKGRLVVRYRDEHGVRQELDALAAAERRCCSFAEWSVTQDGEHVVLTIDSGPDGVAAVAALFGTT